MDELQMVRNCYPEPAPPTAQEIADARALLAEPPRRRLPRLAPRLRWGLGGLVMAGGAAAVAIALVGGNAPAPPGPVQLGGGKGAVLAAAERAERQPVRKYWYVDQVMGQSYVVRAKTGTYAITGALTESFRWSGAQSGLGEAFYSRELPARPTTAQDAALWRKAGSPSRFRVWSSDKYLTFNTAKATKWSADGPETGDGGGFLGGKSVEELQKLPTDPAELTKMFLTDTTLKGLAAGIRREKLSTLSPEQRAELARKAPPIQPRARVAVVGGLLKSTPLPPKVRAGLMRALAAQPGVHEIGRVTDPLGRRGVALAADDEAITVTGAYGGPKAQQGTYRSRAVLVFDERTGAVLSSHEELTKPGGPYAEMKPGFIINYAALRADQWTDTKPTPPAEPPFG